MKKLLLFCFAALILVAFSVPAMAETKISGIVFVDFYYIDRSKEQVAGGIPKGTVSNQSGLSNTRIEVPSITRLRGRWTNEDNVGMFIEFGIGGATGSTGVNLRHAYGWWDINPNFRLMAGHSTTPFSPLNPSMLLGTQSGTLNVIGIGYGEFYSGRYPQVRMEWKYPNDLGRLNIALVDPNGGADPTFPVKASANPGVVTNTVNPGTVIPRIDIGSPFYFGAFRLYPSIYWQSKSYDDVAPGSDDSVDSLGYSLAASWGAGMFSVAAEINGGQNWGNSRGLFGAGNIVTAASAQTYVDGAGNTKIEDSECLGWWLDLGFKLGQSTLHLIVGQASAENDVSPAQGDEWEVEHTMYGISWPITLAKGYTLRPELVFYDDGDDNKTGTAVKTNNGDYTIFGVEFQITF